MTHPLEVQQTQMTKDLEDRGITWPLQGYAPGLYVGSCSVCGHRHMAAKRSWHCLPCAIVSMMTEPAEVEA